MNFVEEMRLRHEEAENNQCRAVVEVASGPDWQIRKFQKEYPEFLWKFTEGLTIPGYILRIARQLEKEFADSDSNIPTDLYPCEYFRIMEHSMPTEIVIQPKRFDKAKWKLSEKMQKYYNSKEAELYISDEQLVPSMACAVRLENVWYRARLENCKQNFIYVYLVDFGVHRQVSKNDIRLLALPFGHYPPMTVKAKVRGAHIQRMDIGKIDRFREVIKSFDYLTRCQIITAAEPHHINICQPNCSEFDNACSFLLAPIRGETGVEGVWLPSEIANNLKRENNANVDTNSGAESDFDSDDDDDYDEVLESEDEDGVFIDVEKCTYLRSFPAIQKAFRLLDNDNLEMERIENEHEIYLTNERMRVSRIDIENYLNDDNRQFSVLPEVWRAFGTACAVRYEGILKRAAIVGIDREIVDLLLIDYGINIKSNASEVFSLPNEDVLCAQSSLIVVSLSAFPNCHFSRIQILRQLLPRGSWVHFVKKQKSKETPTKGELHLNDTSSVSDRVIEEISRLRLNIDCRDIVPYPSLPYGQLNSTISNLDNFIFLYKNQSLTVYKKSKLVTSLY